MEALSPSVSQRNNTHSQNKGGRTISVFTEMKKKKQHKDLANAADATAIISTAEWILVYFILVHFYPSAAASIFKLKDSTTAFVRQGKHDCVNLKQGI